MEYLYDIPTLDTLHTAISTHNFPGNIVQGKHKIIMNVEKVKNIKKIDVGVHLSRIVRSILNKVFKGFFCDYKYEHDHPNKK
jgi:hypothetical protein